MGGRTRARRKSTPSHTPDEVRSQLGKFVEQLRALATRERELLAGRLGAPSISFDLVDLVANAVEQYLNGQYTSLDQAFGLRKRGRPKTDLRKGKHFDLAEKAVLGRMVGKSWRQLCDELGFLDARELQRVEKRYRMDVLKKFSRELSDALDTEQAAQLAARQRATKSLMAKMRSNRPKARR